MNEPKQLSDAELLAADSSQLTTEQLQRKITVINLRKAERELTLVDHENAKFEQERETLRLRNDNRKKDIEHIQAKTSAEQSTCAHMVGGLGLDGILNGDGGPYGASGSSVSPQCLPTGEIYYLCCRCTKEWHLPKKRDVVVGRLTLNEYNARIQEYNDVARRASKSRLFGMGGELPTTVKFNIPELNAQNQKDDYDFKNFLDKKVVAVAIKG